MNDELKKIAKDIMFNGEIHDLIQNPTLIPNFVPNSNQNGLYLYKGLVDFQIEQCKKHGSSINNEGFQIGEPWNGDIENASVLFLSSNPAFDFNEVSPRYYADKKLIIRDGKDMSLTDLIDFQCTRIQESKIEDNDKKTLNKEIFNPETGKKEYEAVSYWGQIRKRTEYLLPDELKIFWEDETQTKSKYARKIMKYVVCMEIVPFRSFGEEGLTKDGDTNFTKNLFDHCWKSFTSKILELSGASIFILVGSKVLKTFIRNFNLHPSIENKLRTGKPFELLLGKRNRTIVYVPYNQGTIPLLPDCLPSETIKQLRDTLARRIIFDNKIASGDF